ncbi:hypothetical protein LTR84_004812 [Exophiala bonariae]|uniref:Uncharacterized protein n=1 Tax=Exophiala bonariae TaxID=1690606 RepID=A0AAV9NNK7_9EURO|nr:hypothetical protein LTR84_004812 [Exophiala bonariae]
MWRSDPANAVWARVVKYKRTFRVKWFENAIEAEKHSVKAEKMLANRDFKLAYRLSNVIHNINTATPEQRREWGLGRTTINSIAEQKTFITGAVRMIIEHSSGETIKTGEEYGQDTLADVNATEAAKLPMYMKNLIGSGDDLQPRYFMLDGLESRSYFREPDKKAPRRVLVSTDQLGELEMTTSIDEIIDWLITNMNTLRVAENCTDVYQQIRRRIQSIYDYSFDVQKLERALSRSGDDVRNGKLYVSESIGWHRKSSGKNP